MQHPGDRRPAGKDRTGSRSAKQEGVTQHLEELSKCVRPTAQLLPLLRCCHHGLVLAPAPLLGSGLGLRSLPAFSVAAHSTQGAACCLGVTALPPVAAPCPELSGSVAQPWLLADVTSCHCVPLLPLNLSAVPACPTSSSLQSSGLSLNVPSSGRPFLPASQLTALKSPVFASLPHCSQAQ